MWRHDLSTAYYALGIELSDRDSSADEDVAVAFYRKSTVNDDAANYSHLLDALLFIAEARQSRFLRFFATIAEHLDEKNVAVLAKKTFAASPEPENVGFKVDGAERMDAGPTNEESSQISASESTESEVEMDASGECDTTSKDSRSWPRSPSSAEASIPSSDEMSTVDSDFSEEVGGIFFDGRVWRCEACSAMLVDWKCPNGHETRRCETCGWQLDNGPCQRCLAPGACGAESFDGPGGDSGVVEGSEDEDEIYFDEMEKLWRCSQCLWEVEADNETDGNCRCLNDKGELHFIDLADCLDYEPADSCSSEDEPTDSEPDSDDERFVDDAEIPLEGIASNVAIDTIHRDAWYKCTAVPEVNNPLETAKVGNIAEGKENIEPMALLNEVEAVDGQTVNDLPSITSNIVDCESMDI